jgi:OmpA-OmpF porin, OOP family
MVTTQASRSDDNDDDALLAIRHADERQDNLLVGGGLLVALVVVLGVLGQSLGWFNRGEADWSSSLKPIFGAMVPDAKAANAALPTRISVVGVVAQEATKTDLMAMLSSSFPNVPVDDRVRVQEKTTQPNVLLRIDDKFGGTKRFAMAWQKGKFNYDGAFYDPAMLTAATKAHGDLPEAVRGEFRCRAAERPVIDPSVLSATLKQKLEGKVIEFDVGKDTLTPAGALVLDELAGDLKTLTGLRITVEGHTDADGDASLNRSLSLGRSQAVVRYLGGKGADPKRFDARGFGGDRPKAPNDTAENKQLNRRVEMYAREAD